MTIIVKISRKPIEYKKAISLLEKRVLDIQKNKDTRELIWILEHSHIYTCGTNVKKNEILDKSIKIIKTNRGGKITYHGPGQLIFYFVINLNKRKKDIRWFISIIEKTIIETLNEYNIKSFNDKKNIGIWTKYKKDNKKIAAIGLKIKKWIAFHGFSLNVSVDLNKYKKIMPCGLNNDKVINLKDLSDKKFTNLRNKLIDKFKKNLVI